ncbi:hypothetical protein CDAR_43241 [Caerostris darwini]|uniref:Uncharacterized protein n=1 Tax=Caerostris darwini TaxID=1538125 RepID=A0AAV4WGL3_9ARAC|nr:hypothetical protein CDAR_43241 [Caerostris darwini]
MSIAGDQRNHTSFNPFFLPWRASNNSSHLPCCSSGCISQMSGERRWSKSTALGTPRWPGTCTIFCHKYIHSRERESNRKELAKKKASNNNRGEHLPADRAPLGPGSGSEGAKKKRREISEERGVAICKQSLSILVTSLLERRIYGGPSQEFGNHSCDWDFGNLHKLRIRI